MRKYILLGSLMVVIVSVLIGCGRSSSHNEKDVIIKNIVKGANNVKSKILANKLFKDYKAYQDGANFGVVYEYVVSDNRYLVPNPNKKVLKSRIAASLKKHPLYFKMSEFFRDGLYFKYVYRKTDGSMAYELILDKGDF